MRAARALLGWSQDDLAQASGVSVPTIKRIEPGPGPVKATDDVLAKIVRAFVASGVEFIASDAPSEAGGFGVRIAAQDDLARLRALHIRLVEASSALRAAVRLTNDPSVQSVVQAAGSEVDSAIRLVDASIDAENIGAIDAEYARSLSGRSD